MPARSSAASTASASSAASGCWRRSSCSSGAGRSGGGACGRRTGWSPTRVFCVSGGGWPRTSCSSRKGRVFGNEFRGGGVPYGMGRRVLRIVLFFVSAAVTVAIFAVAPNASQNYLTYGTFAAAGAPPRIDYCGRRYYPGTLTLTMLQVRTDLAKNDASGLARIGTTPSGMPIVANVMSPALQAERHTSVCTMAVWVQTGPNSYKTYGLSGGP